MENQSSQHVGSPKEVPTLAAAAITFVVLAVAALTVTAIKVTSFSLGGIAAVLLLAMALLFLAVSVWHPVEKPKG